MFYLDIESKIMWDTGTKNIVSYHVSTACDEIQRLGKIVPSGVSGRSSLGGNSIQPFMISTYAEEDLAENLLFFFTACLLLGAQTLTARELKRFAKKQMKSVKPNYTNIKLDPDFSSLKEQSKFDLDLAIENYAKALDMPLFVRESLELIGDAMADLYDAAGAIDPVMLTTNWMEPFLADPMAMIEKLCVYKVHYEAKYFLDYGGIFGSNYRVNALDSIYTCELVNSGWDTLRQMYDIVHPSMKDASGIFDPDFVDSMIKEEALTASDISYAVQRGQNYKIENPMHTFLQLLNRSFWANKRPQNLTIETSTNPEARRFVEIDDVRHLKGINFVLEGELDPTKIATFNAPECEIRYFTKGIPLIENAGLSGNYAFKIKDARTVLDDVADRYRRKGYVFEDKEFPLFWIKA